MSSTVLPDLRLWGKLGTAAEYPYPAICHMLDTAAAASVLWDGWVRAGLRDILTDALAAGTPVRARGIVAAVAGLHDLGKISKVFQLRQLAAFGQTEPAATYVHRLKGQLRRSGYDVTIPTVNLTPRTRRLSPDSTTAATLRRHEALSMHLLAETWPGSAHYVGDAWAAAIVGGHHGRFTPHDGDLYAADQIDDARSIPEFAPAQIVALTGGVWGQQQQAHLDAVLRVCDIDRADIRKPLVAREATTVILSTGIVTLADWLASEVPSILTGRDLLGRVNPAADPFRWFAERRRYFTGKLEETLGTYSDIPSPRNDILGKHAATPTDLQQVAATVGGGLWVATVPTGDGKTEAAILRHAAVSNEGMSFALPTRSTTDAMFGRVTRFHSSTTNAGELLHSYASLDPYYLGGNTAPESELADGSGHWGLHPQAWLRGRLHTLVAPVAVGTCDQVLLASLRQRWSFLRLLAIANRHVILDEVHTYDHYQARLLSELLSWWGATGTRVTMLSASLPTPLLNQYLTSYTGEPTNVPSIYPGWTTARSGVAPVQGSVGARREYMLRFNLIDTPASDVVAAHVAQVARYRKLSEHTHIAVVVNTVDRCIAVAAALKAAGQDVLVLHSRMTAGHRKYVSDRIEQLRTARGGYLHGLVVVGTQTIEASLDVDFDHMITDLAPAPSLIQRAGRLWRHSHITDGLWDHTVFDETVDPPVPLYIRKRHAESPVLDVIVMRLDQKPQVLAVETRFPYLMAEQKRTLNALQSVGRKVHIPTGVQHLVDASVPESPFRDNMDLIDREFDRGIGSSELVEEEAAALKRLAAAGKVVIPMVDGAPGTNLIDPELRFSTLAASTTRENPDEFNGSATRFVEYDSNDFLLIDPTGNTKWAWHGDAQAAAAVRPGTTQARALLSCAIPLRMSQLGKLANPVVAADDWEPRAGAFKRLLPVIVAPGARYDEVFGLVG